MRIIKQLIDAKEELIEAKKSLDNAISESRKLAKENKKLLSKIESAEKRGGVLLLNEIDAQNYLLSVSNNYHIPESELEVTKKNLADYEKALEEYYESLK